MGYLSSCHVYSLSYGHYSVANDLFSVFTAHASKKPVTVGAKYLRSESERSHLALRKCYGLLLGSEVPLTRCKSLKIQDFSIFCSVFMIFLPLISHKR